MPPSSENVAPPRPDPARNTDLRLITGVLLLVPAALFTWRTIEGLSARRDLRMELAEISHVRYGLLNANVWVDKLVPILDSKIDALDLKAVNQASLRPTVENALYHLLDDVKEKMSAKPAAGAQSPPATGLGGFLAQGNPLIANMMIGALRPHVPEYADVVLAELGKPETKEALKKYIKSVLADGAKTTFGNVEMKWYSYILKEHGCSDGNTCQQVLGDLIREDDEKIRYEYLTVLASAAVAFAFILTGGPVLRRPGVVVLMLFCLILLAGGILTPMIEVEARISHLGMTFLGEPITFQDQLLYFQSKSVLEVFHTLITMGRPDMWIVGVLVLMFSIVFPTLKISTLTFCLFQPGLLRRSRLVKFLALESSKWSMADVMALAIFMAYVAFNGVITNTMNGLKQTGAQIVIPTDSSKILPGYLLFIGFCLASLFLSKKLERGIRTREATD